MDKEIKAAYREYMGSQIDQAPYAWEQLFEAGYLAGLKAAGGLPSHENSMFPKGTTLKVLHWPDL